MHDIQAQYSLIYNICFSMQTNFLPMNYVIDKSSAFIISFGQHIANKHIKYTKT